jgi:hypothetical protein
VEEDGALMGECRENTGRLVATMKSCEQAIPLYRFISLVRHSQRKIVQNSASCLS